MKSNSFISFFHPFPCIQILFILFTFSFHVILKLFKKTFRFTDNSHTSEKDEKTESRVHIIYNNVRAI